MRLHGTLLVALGTLVLSGGCATILKDKYETVTISSEPSGASVSVNRKLVGDTPMSIRLDGRKDHWILISKDGYEPKNVLLKSRINVNWALLDFLIPPFIISSIVDAATGNWRSLDQKSVGVLLEKW